MSQEQVTYCPLRERSNSARIGFFGKGRMYEAYIRTDDECQVPHFHIRNIYTETDTPILLQSNHYCPHSHKDSKVLSDTELQQLACFMAEPCRSPRYADNYEFAVTMWNLNNQSKCSWQKVECGCSIIPDYRSMNTRITIIKSITDNYDCDHFQTDEDINPLSCALTKKFLNKDGVLQSFRMIENGY